MGRATICYNAEHTMAAITITGNLNDDNCGPIDAQNQALAALYENEDLAPYFYAVYQDEEFLGMLVAGDFGAESDAEIRALYFDIVNKNSIAPETTGIFATKVVEV